MALILIGVAIGFVLVALLTFIAFVGGVLEWEGADDEWVDDDPDP